MNPDDLRTPEAARLWRLLERSELIAEDDSGLPRPDYERIVRLVQECQLDPTFKRWVIECALDGTRPMRGEHMRELCDTLGVDVRCLLYDAPPEEQAAKPLTIQQVLRLRL